MAEKRVFAYEAMFLVGQAAAADLAGVVTHINEILGRAHAEIVAMRKWDERRLAFEIKKQKRGLYILCYFRCDARAIAGIERDCNLSEKILRVLLLRCDHLTADEMTAADGRTDLETEAKLRAKQAEAGPVASGAPAAAAAPTESATAVAEKE